MTTAYNAYKAKQQKGKTTRTKTDANASQVLFDMMDKTMTKIRAVDRSAWTDEENTNFQIALTGLGETIETVQVPPSINLA